MSVDFFPCDHCSQSICDCGDYVRCNDICSRHWCDMKCAEADGLKRDEETCDRDDNTCKFCRNEDVEDGPLLEFLLDHFKMTLEEAKALCIASTPTTTTKRTPSDTFLASPFAVAVDTREQLPYEFLSLRADACDHHRPLLIPTERTTLLSGDYSIVGHADKIAIERKSLEDLYSTLGQGRERFTRELERLNVLEFGAFVMVEAEWSTVLQSPPVHSQLNPKTVIRSVMRWQFDFPHVRWWMMPGRRAAEAATYQLLRKYWTAVPVKEANESNLKE
jgi:DNA excision repair protein ERCC-4